MTTQSVLGKHRIRVHDPSLAADLVQFLRRRRFAVVQVGPGTIDAGLSRPTSPVQARVELGLHLDVWRVLHPGAAVALVPGGVRDH
jgi:hypothetical protein